MKTSPTKSEKADRELNQKALWARVLANGRETAEKFAITSQEDIDRILYAE